MVSLSDNAIAQDPRNTLTRTQQDALKAIAFFRRQRKTGSRWLVGDKRISQKVVLDLEKLDLVDEGRLRSDSVLVLTTAGNLAVERLSH
jgi:hypothetical protein